MSLVFKKRVEDFRCEYCSVHVKGNGFTNHCPDCLWSKHVDVFPGDRKEICGGLMKPKSLLLEKNIYVIIHQCVRCGIERRNKAASEDAIEILLNTK